jgi:hypothetical protein
MHAHSSARAIPSSIQASAAMGADYMRAVRRRTVAARERCASTAALSASARRACSARSSSALSVSRRRAAAPGVRGKAWAGSCRCTKRTSDCSSPSICCSYRENTVRTALFVWAAASSRCSVPVIAAPQGVSLGGAGRGRTVITHAAARTQGAIGTRRSHDRPPYGSRQLPP